MFEKKEVKSESYPAKLLQEYARDKVKRLLNKYDNLRRSNEDF